MKKLHCAMVGPPVAGAVYDATQSYDVSFFLAGGFMVLVSFVSFGTQILHRRKKSKKMENNIKK